MSGIEFLLDTNFVIGLLLERSPSVELKRRLGVLTAGNSISQISRIELLGHANLTPVDERRINQFISFCTVLRIESEVEECAIDLRRTTRLKLPDAIILATARVHGLRLVTLDQRLAELAEA